MVGPLQGGPSNRKGEWVGDPTNDKSGMILGLVVLSEVEVGDCGVVFCE